MPLKEIPIKIRKRDIIQFVGLIVIVLLFLAILVYLNFAGIINVLKIQEEISEFGSYAPLIFILLYIIAMITFFPVTIMTIVGALVFGTLQGTVYSLIGAMIGCIIAFYISRLLGKRFIDSLTEIKFKRVHKYNKKIRQNGFMAAFITRVSPLIHYASMSYVFGLTKIGFVDYFFGTLFGMGAWIFAIGYLSQSLVSLSPLDITFSAIFFLILIFIIPIYHYLKKFIKSRISNKSIKKR